MEMPLHIEALVAAQPLPLEYFLPGVAQGEELAVNTAAGREDGKIPHQRSQNLSTCGFGILNRRQGENASDQAEGLAQQGIAVADQPVPLPQGESGNQSFGGVILN